MPFSLFSLNFKWKMAMVLMNFLWISHHFDLKFVGVAESDHVLTTKKILVAVQDVIVPFAPYLLPLLLSTEIQSLLY